MKTLTRIESATFGIALVFGVASAPVHAEGRDSVKASNLFAYIEPCWDMVRNKKPLSTSVSLVEDPQGDGTTIDFHNVKFKTFRAQFYREPDGTIQTAALSTSSTSFKLPWGLKFGQSKTQVHAVLGKPTQSDSKAFVYTVSGTQSSVMFYFKRDGLAEVTWEYDLH